jgi:hypothetical protein
MEVDHGEVVSNKQHTKGEQMNLSDLGSLANLIAAVGVMISLIFVAVQIKASTLEMKAAHWESLLDRISNLTSRTLDRDVAEIVQKGIKSFNGLSDTEKVVFASWAHEFVVTASQQRRMGALGLLRPALVNVANERLTWLFKAGGPREWWKGQNRIPLVRDLEATIDELILSINLEERSDNKVND